MFRNVLPKNEHFVIVYSCPVSFRPPYFLQDFQALLYTQEKWMVIYADNSKKATKVKTVSYVIVSYSLFFQLDILVLLLNAINLSFKGQRNWLSELNAFYFIFWALYGITNHVQAITYQKYEKSFYLLFQFKGI